ncbi:LMBR1 domain-containing protein 2 homolog isoform X2 [Chrysoperla carnea]|uniref:LMBR1 domain-containing protein 2 homolog isoform X2 n=1 Tax=Chrysoperla carnea TaxID=189513 RepID=UPI001D064F95|nr:LMBR1 domain-containing protein 2 homolog isoform X2 [Chrysoperla carnea]
MSVTLFVTEVICAFILSASILYRYGNWFRHHIIVTLAVLIAWYFSFLIIFVLPLDVSSTVFRQCTVENIHVNSTFVSIKDIEVTDIKNDSNQTSSSTENPLTPSSSSSVPPPIPQTCQEPWSYVPDNILKNLWRVVYWTSLFLTWLVMPMMQSYSKAGEFTVRGKLKSALIDNAIYYGSYLFICGVLLIYIALKPGIDLDGQKIIAIASSASNTWGLFLLVMLLGYALIDVPREYWRSAQPGYLLSRAYFKATKLNCDKCEAEETVDDILESLQAANLAIGPNHPLYNNMETVMQKIPTELRDRMARRQLPADINIDAPSEKQLIRLHKQVIKALHTLQRTEIQWGILVKKICDLEDISNNQTSHTRRFKHTFQNPKNAFSRIFYNPTIEWYWKCIIQRYIRLTLALITGLLSFAVVWSEVTFFNRKPVLSIFARYLAVSKDSYDYLTIELLSTIVIAYMCYCAYSTVLKIRVLNLYYLAPHHQTNEYSLIFSGMMLSRLTPPICLNFLGLIHMDSHVIKSQQLETLYTQVMGHMDVISIISDGFNVYFPIAILAFCLATYFRLGARILIVLGFHQFIGNDELTYDMVDEGRELIKREKRKRQRAEDSMNRRREFQERFQIGGRNRNIRNSTDTVRPLNRDESMESARAGLLRDVDPVDYYVSNPSTNLDSLAGGEIDSRFGISTRDAINDRQGYQSAAEDMFEIIRGGRDRVGPPPRGIFDDV